MPDTTVHPAPRVYVQSNAAAGNEVLAFERRDGGRLAPCGRFATGGHGTGVAHLPSQGSLALSDDGAQLLVVNAGSHDVSLLAVSGDAMTLADRVPSGGATPTSVAIRGDLVYVLNNGTPNIAGFRFERAGLVAIAGSVRPLSSPDADPAQISFDVAGDTIVVTERGTDAISAYAVGSDGLTTGPATIAASGRTPYGFDVTPGGVLIVTEAFGGDVGAAAAASYAVTGPGTLAPIGASVGNTRSEVCWAAVTRDGRFAYVTNFGDGTVSSYAIGDDGALALHDAVAASTRPGRPGVRDAAISRDGRYLYAIDADAQQLFGWAVGADGGLTAVGAFDGVPATVAGLAAS